MMSGMTAPTINGTRYPQPVDALLPQARQLVDQSGQVPSRNRLMREFRIGAPKADEIRARLAGEQDRQAEADRMRAHLLASGSTVERVELFPAARPVYDYPAPIGPDRAPVDTGGTPGSEPAPVPAEPAETPEPSPQVADDGHPGTKITPRRVRPVAVWPVILLALPAFVAVWSGWVELGRLTGFGRVNLLPGIGDGWHIDSAITLPIGVETYAAYALYVWLSGRVPDRARRFAKWSALGSLVIGALGQVAYHLLAAAGVTAAPWQITTAVACLPPAVLGMGAALAHLVREDTQ